jgi:hypothetical protein
MWKKLRECFEDDCGALLAVEWLFVCSILVLGAVTGLVGIRNMLLTQMGDVAGAIGALDPSYEVRGVHNRESATAGSGFIRNEVHIHGPLVGPNHNRGRSQTQRGADLEDPLPCD